MAKQRESDPTSTPGQSIDTSAFAGLIGESVAKALEERQPKKVTFGQYTRRINKGRHTLTRLCFDNGYPIPEHSLSNEEIDGLNAITHSGRYLDRMVEVIVRDEGEAAVELRYKNATPDQRLTNARLWSSFLDLLNKINAVQAQERAEAEEAEAIQKERRAHRVKPAQVAVEA